MKQFLESCKMCSIISNCRWNILFVENVIKKSTWGCLCLSAAAAGSYITETCCIIFLFILRRCLQENWIKEAHCNKNQNTLHRLQQSGNRKFSFFVVLNKWKTLKKFNKSLPSRNPSYCQEHKKSYLNFSLLQSLWQKSLGVEICL